ncbi:MAG TPA: class I SAM-dependent methyltransferase [Verrucomicrobiae bacterium]|nr:class I SAM-dependent methyltransferase [Verrucomicrobiae bacterium]
MRNLIEEIYTTRTVIGRNGKIHQLDSNISVEEGQLLSSLIRDNPNVTKTLEIGCAYGLSSLHICQALSERTGAHHTIIDPFQNSMWDGAGTANLERSGFDFFELLEEKSEFALPNLCKQGEDRFDLVFIDGFHTFDHTLIDSFFATRLLRVGGFLVIDDTSWRSVNRCVRYLENYPCYELYRTVSQPKPLTAGRRIAKSVRNLLPQELSKKVFHPNFVQKIWADQQHSMVALKKVASDTRDWKWYVEF